jgi:predicted nucleic acid-binding protein
VIPSPDGLLDTNVFLHTLTNDAHSEECRQFLAALEHGQVEAWLDPLILHELSYALRRWRKQVTRAEVAEYLLVVLGWPGIHGDKDLMVTTVERWRDTPGLGFVDAYLAALASRRGAVVYTKNVRDFTGQGVPVPQPLPS